MVFLWMVAGIILGWISIEIISGAVKRYMPISFNIGMAFVGGLIGYTLAI